MSPNLIASFRQHFEKALIRGALWVEIQSADGKLRWVSSSSRNTFCDFRDKFTFDEQEAICPEVKNLQRGTDGTHHPINF